MAIQTMLEIPRETVSMIARGLRMLNARGIMHKSGHVSARDPRNPNVLWINSRKASRSTLTVRDIVPVDVRTAELIGEGDEPPSEVHMHTSIYRKRGDVGSIVHSHPEHIVALSVAGKALVPVTVDGYFLGATVPVFNEAAHVNTPERGDEVAELLGSAPVIVLSGHGIIVTGSTIEESVTRIVQAEDNARMLYLAWAIGEPRALPANELAAISAASATPKAIRKSWHYEEETARRAGALEGVDV
jgi:ribulose-5-phosphate 4-epimerase/fuculose-1-phosphate aldolase